MKIIVKISSKKYLGRYTYKCDIFIDSDYILTASSKKKSIDIAFNLSKKLNCEYEVLQN